MPIPTIRLLAAAAAVLLAGAASAQTAAPSFTAGPLDEAEPAAERPRLGIGAGSAAALATGALTFWLASAIENGADEVTSCRWCEPGRLDRWARGELRWRDTRAAARASDLLLLGIPIGGAAAVTWAAARDGAPLEIVEDLAMIASAISITDPLTAGMKHAAGRLRPQVWAGGGAVHGKGDLHSFFSGHTSRVFTVAAAAAQVSRLRARRGWKWIAGAAFTAAAATGWMRIAADQHWATDVLGGAVLGTAVGWAVPGIALGSTSRRSSGATLALTPGGLAVVF